MYVLYIVLYVCVYMFNNIYVKVLKQVYKSWPKSDLPKHLVDEEIEQITVLG